MGEAQAGIKITGRNINSLRYADDATLMAESEEDLMFQIPMQYCFLQLFTASYFASITNHIHKWVLFLLWQIDSRDEI